MHECEIEKIKNNIWSSCFLFAQFTCERRNKGPSIGTVIIVKKKKKVKRNYKLQREAGIFLILIENKEGIRDFIAGMLELVMVIMERRKIGRIFEIDKWKEASTCKGINMVGQGENEQ